MGDRERGIVAELEDGTYRYTEVSESYSALTAFEDEYAGAKFHYWIVNTYSCVRVTRDDEFVAKMLSELAAVWARITSYRNDPSLLLAEIGLPPVPVKRKVTYAFRETPPMVRLFGLNSETTQEEILAASRHVKRVIFASTMDWAWIDVTDFDKAQHDLEARGFVVLP